MLTRCTGKALRCRRRAWREAEDVYQANSGAHVPGLSISRKPVMLPRFPSTVQLAAVSTDKCWHLHTIVIDLWKLFNVKASYRQSRRKTVRRCRARLVFVVDGNKERKRKGNGFSPTALLPAQKRIFLQESQFILYCITSIFCCCCSHNNSSWFRPGPWSRYWRSWLNIIQNVHPSV